MGHEVTNSDYYLNWFLGESRPQSETNSLIQSCSSALSGVDDKRLDDILGDGIRNQNLTENQVKREKREKSRMSSGH